MADEATVASAPAAEPAPPITTEPTPAVTTQTNGETEDKKEDKPAEAEKPVETAQTNGDKEPESDKPADEPARSDEIEDASTLDATPGGSKDKKRKSIGGVPEHKAKKLNKKKSMPTLHLECKPGDFYWARLKGYPPWPAVICDESMLPESLLASRPVSTARPDGSLRDDFKEGGKNAKERTFPIMFMFTNEFQWMVNTALTPLDPEECKTMPQSKMTKALQNAYKVASENHDLQYFKDILKQFQEEEELFQRQQAEALAEAERIEAERAAQAEKDAEEGASAPKTKKKAPRKSKAADEDVEMEDADVPKSSKKRKSAADSDGEKPKKTPRVTKLNAPKTPNGEASGSKKSSAKPKKKVVTAPKVEEEDETKPQMSEEEKLAAREKAILYLRHRLQKGFLSRDSTPQESEMPGMAEFFSQLEAYTNLEPSIIRATKIHKVLKAIVKLVSVPRDDEFHFKKRSSALLEVWNKSMEEAPPATAEDAAAAKAPAVDSTAEPVPEPAAAATDAESKEEAAADEKKADPVEKPADTTDKPAEKANDEAAEKPSEPSVEAKTDEKDEKDETVGDVGDVSMHTAPEDVPT
ncbi:hypothetical protein M409DRAFT_25272 [Zasmidium cellare ATCC 36951]|uniref:PWWP domain-containing protein n=1 Tax=Zasmidium cellare ATCC 36951 TaxID=1080233 RepID=A0A6A6CB35_ZASCE|nr:uncharacterized protein M409DRAFT_25272 [Zasmidium cellare ATCC 36951]KAF2164394.1 hypothetical protein M409DRAFT_25272 [Zasmidium cellare ATCC 36951]